MGSTVFVIDKSETYMLNGQRKWVKVALSGGNISGDIIYDGGNPEDTTDNPDDIIYEGGVI